MKKYLLFCAFLALTFTGAFAQYTACFQIEDVTLEAGSNWNFSTTNSGFSGAGYLEWLGGDKFSTPSRAADILTFTFNVTTAGKYTVWFRGRRDQGQCGCPAGAASDACNDIYTKMNNGNWIKTMVKGSWGAWIWQNEYEPGSSVITTVYDLSAGQHTIQVSGRSAGVKLDGFIVQPLSAAGPSGLLSCIPPYCETFDYTVWDLSKPDGYEAQGVQEAGKNGIQINTINQPKDKWAAARATFQGDSGKYDIILTSLLETDGESSYKVLINGNEVLQFKNKRILGTAIGDYTPYTVGIKNIVVPDDADVQVDFISNSNELVAEGSGFAYARGRWRSLNIGNCSDIDVDLWVSGDPYDLDGDGAADTVDNCPYIGNANQLDTDGDGIGDVCDDDIDGDGIANETDNCPTVANAGQEDRDGDGIGDICDPNPDNACSKNPTISGGNGAQEGQTPYSENKVPGIIEAEHFDNGGPGVAYYDGDARDAGSNQNFRVEETIDIDEYDGTNESSGLAIGYIKFEGEWAEYTIDVQTAGKYQITLNYGCNGDKDLYFKFDNSLISCLHSLPSTGKATTYQEYTIPQTFELSVGTHVFAWINESTKAFNLDYFKLHLEGVPLSAENIEESKYMAFPNPFNDVINISTHGERATVELFNVNGQKLHVYSTQSDNTISLSVGNLPKGFYFLKINNGTSYQTLKVYKK